MTLILLMKFSFFCYNKFIYNIEKKVLQLFNEHRKVLLKHYFNIIKFQF